MYLYLRPQLDSEDAFTLVEILLATALVAVIAAMVFGSLYLSTAAIDGANWWSASRSAASSTTTNSKASSSSSSARSATPAPIPLLDLRAQYDAIRDETRQQIRAILTDEQQVRFEQRMREFDRRIKPPRR